MPPVTPARTRDRRRGGSSSPRSRAAIIALGRRHWGHVLTVALQFLSLGLSVATFRLAASWFGAIGFGEYALARRALSVVTFPLLLGLGTSLPRFATRHRSGCGSPGPASYAMATLLIASLVLAMTVGTIACLPIPFASLVFGDTQFARLSRPTLAAIVGLYLHMLAYSLLIGRFRTVAASALQVVNVAAAPGLAVMVSGGDVSRALIALGAITALTSIVAAVGAARGLGVRESASGPLIRPIKDLLAFGLPRVPGELALFGLFALPAFVVAKRVGVEEAGLVSFGMSLIQLVGSVFAAGAMLLLPVTGRMFAEGQARRVRRVVEWVLGLSLAASVALVAALEVTLGPFVGLILGPDLAKAAGSARGLLLGSVPYVAFIVLRGPLDAASTWPHAAINLGIALIVEALCLFAGSPPEVGMPVALFVLGVLMIASWARALGGPQGHDP